MCSNPINNSKKNYYKAGTKMVAYETTCCIDLFLFTLESSMNFVIATTNCWNC